MGLAELFFKLLVGWGFVAFCISVLFVVLLPRGIDDLEVFFGHVAAQIVWGTICVTYFLIKATGV